MKEDFFCPYIDGECPHARYIEDRDEYGTHQVFFCGHEDASYYNNMLFADKPLYARQKAGDTYCPESITDYAGYRDLIGRQIIPKLTGQQLIKMYNDGIDIIPLVSDGEWAKDFHQVFTASADEEQYIQKLIIQRMLEGE